MLRFAVEADGPVAIRYPRGGDGAYTDCSTGPVLREGKDITLCAYGTMINQVLSAAELLLSRGISAEVVKINRVKPLELDCLVSAGKTRHLLIAEEVVSSGAVFESICAANRDGNIALKGLSLGDSFVTHGDTKRLYEAVGLSAEKIADAAEEMLAGGSYEA